MKLQNALQGMQAQLHTANANILKKQEENKILHSQLQIVSREKSVLETSEANIQELRRENEHLKASTESFQKKTSEMQRELIRAQKEIAEWQRKAEEAESKFMRTKQILQRFEEKNSNVDHEKQVLRQQAIVISPTNGLTNVVKPIIMQAPRSSRTSMSKGSRSPNVGGASQQVLSSHWHSIIKILNSLLNMLRANHVPPFFISKLFTQVFSFINGQLFNSLLLRRECCSFSNGEYVKSGLAELERWICEASEKYAGTSWHELRYIRQAVGFLVIHQKRKKSLDEILHDLCPVLSIQQLYRISTMYWDDKYGTQSVSNEVISSMREIVQNDSHNFLNNSFLLDDDLSIPFSADDISNTIGQIDLSDVEPPPLLREVPTFHFLLRHSE